MTNKVSIIIPVYNGEKYVSRMLNCIKDQTYQNIQVIIAYDTKSTDKTLEILKSYQQDFPYELIVDEACDSSTGEARNRGYKLANGDFVIFIDADDYIFPTMIEDYLRGILENKTNISTGKYSECINENFIKTKEKLQKINDKKLKHSIVKTTDALNDFWKPRKYAVPCWNYLIRKSYLEEENIQFINSSRGDDMLFIIQCLKHTPEISTCNHYGYLYFQFPNSIAHTIPKNKNEFLKLCFDKQRECEDCLPTIRISFYLHNLLSNLFYNVNFSYEEFINNNKKNGIRKIPCFSELNWKEKVAIIGYNVHPKIFYYGVRCYKSWKK